MQSCISDVKAWATANIPKLNVSAIVLSRIDYCNSLLFGSTHDVTSHQLTVS